MTITDRFGAQPAFIRMQAWKGGRPVQVCVAQEHTAEILVNESPAFRVVCTPELLPQLALGRLLTEGWITSAGEVEHIAVCAEGRKISVHLTRLLETACPVRDAASCCTDNYALEELSAAVPLRPVPRLDVPGLWVRRLSDAMEAGLPLYSATRSVHSCLLLHQGEILYRCEDLGRHNALDKAIGCAALDGVRLGECVLFSSGRVPVDMVRKAIRAGVPALVSKSLPTVQSVELAEQYGLRLFFCAREGDAFQVL